MISAFQANAFQTNPLAFQIQSGDTHDGSSEGGKKPWHQRIEKEAVNKLAQEYRISRAKLREDIIFAMDGPAEAEVLSAIRPEVTHEELYSAPDFEPELKGLLSQTEALRRIARAVLEERARQEMLALEADDEEAITLLLH